MDEEHPLLPVQIKLTIELKRNNLYGFRELLPNHHEEYNVQTSMSIFELACRTPHRAEFIKECINVGCDVNKVNEIHQMGPINFTLESYCKHNLRALLNEPTVNIDKKCPAWLGKTPINFLVSRIDDDNFQKIFSCIKILVEHFANLNITDNEGISPVSRLLDNDHLNDGNKWIILAYLFDNAVELDIDSYKNGSNRRSLEKNFPDLNLPAVCNENRTIWNFDELKKCLEDMNESEFLKGINYISERNEINLQQSFDTSDGKFTLLSFAVESDLGRAVERMLRLGADINFKPPGNFTFTPIECACRNGFWRTLEILLRSQKINTDIKTPLLSTVIQNNSHFDEPRCEQDYNKCFQLLVQSPKINIDQLDSQKRASALYYAIKYNKQEFIDELIINKGAYIGFENILDLCSNIHPKSVEKYLNSWIMATNRPKYHLGDGGFEIEFNYKNLVSPIFKQTKGKCKDCNKCAKEMKPIKYMSKSKELCYLLKHPLIQSFLYLKWQRLAFIFYINIFAYFLFTVSILSYTLSSYLDANAPETFRSNLLWWLSCIMTSVIIFRELFQLTLSPLTHLKGVENYFEIALLFTVTFVLSNVDVPENQRRTIVTVTILLVTSEMFILLGSLGIFSIHFIMLKTVLISFVKGLALYVVILVAFSLSFFALLHESNYELGTNQNETSSEPNENVGFNKFNSIELSLMKVFVMLTGEFEAGDINFRLNPFSYWLFLVFLFLISTVLFNLLNGLAVSDIQQIREEAELTYLKQRVNLLSKFERILLGRHIIWCFHKRLVPSGINIFKFLIHTDYKVKVLPETDNFAIANLQSSNNVFKSCCTFGGCNLRMPKNIMESAELVLHKKNIELNEEDEKRQLYDRMSNLERKLDSVLLILNDIKGTKG